MLHNPQKEQTNLRIYGFASESIVDGPGIRVVVFVQGCQHACIGCHNPDSWDPAGGQEYTPRDIVRKIKTATGRTQVGLPAARASKKALSRDIRGVTFSGGEPFMQAQGLCEVGRAVKRMGLDIATYTGNTYEELITRDDADVQALLDISDYLIDGAYVHELRDISLKFRGSTNQRVIDMNATRKVGQVVLWGAVV